MPLSPYAENPAALLQRLIQFNTTNPPGNEGECAAFIASLLAEAGLTPQIIAKDPARPNLMAVLPGRGLAPPLLLYGHMDVVPTVGQQWTHDPFSGSEIDGFIWGRGAVDMKGPLAMLLAAFLRMAAAPQPPAGDLLFLAVSDEEVSGAMGAEFLTTEHPDLFKGVQHAIGEFGGFNLEFAGQRFYPIQVAEKQGCGIVFHVSGPGGHGSQVVHGTAAATLGALLTALERRRPPLHVTPALRQMVSALAAELPAPHALGLRALLVPGLNRAALRALPPTARRVFAPLLQNTLNTTILNGGNAVNVIPTEITVQTDVRLLPGHTAEGFLAGLTPHLPPNVRAEIVYNSPNPAAAPDLALFDQLAAGLRRADPTGAPVPWFLSAVTDARFFNRLGIQTYGFTPMQFPDGLDFASFIHAPDERIPLAAVHFGADILTQVLHDYH